MTEEGKSKKVKVKNDVFKSITSVSTVSCSGRHCILSSTSILFFPFYFFLLPFNI